MKIMTLLLTALVFFSLNSCESPSLMGKKVKKEYFTGGKVRSEFIMDDDTEQNGLLKMYGYGGHLTSTVHIRNGVKNGLETGFDKKKRVLWKQTYINGKLHGLQQALYPNGEVMISYTYNNGFKHGPAYTYKRNGKIDKRAIYRNGRLIN